MEIQNHDIEAELLTRRALEGDLEASRKMYEMCKREGDVYRTYKYACFRCMQGDVGMLWELLRREIPITTCFPEDDPHHDDRLERAGASEVSYLVVNPFAVGMGLYPEEFAGHLRNEAEAGDSIARVFLAMSECGSLEEFQGRSEIADDPMVMTSVAYCLLGSKAPASFFSGFRHMSEPDVEEGVRILRENAFARSAAASFLADMECLGVKVERDWDSALEHALFAAERGQLAAGDLVRFLVGASRPDDGDVEDFDYEPRYPGDPVYAIPETLRWNCREWESLVTVTGSDNLMRTSNPEFANGYDGFENEVFAMRPASSDEEIPAFLFKPTGFAMDWVLEPWTEGCMSEPLSAGQVRHIWRLCLDSVLFGDTYEPGDDTVEWLRSQPYRTVIPDGELRGRVDALLASIPKTPGDWHGTTDCDWTYPWNRAYWIHGIHQWSPEVYAWMLSVWPGDTVGGQKAPMAVGSGADSKDTLSREVRGRMLEEGCR